MGSDIQQKSEVRNFGHEWEDPSSVSPLVKNSDLSIKNTLKSVLNLITVITLKRGKESILFQSNKFTGGKVRDGKDVAKSLVVFNLGTIIHPFQSKKNLRA